MLRKELVILAISLYASALFASDDMPGPSVSVGKKRSLIGDRISLIVEAKKLKDLELDFPKFEKGRIGSFAVLDEALYEKSFFGSASVIKKYTISSYEVGKLTIPEFEIKYKRKNAKEWKIAKTKPLYVIIESALPKGIAASDIRDIKGPKGPLDIGWAPTLIGGFFVSGIIILLVVAIKKRLRKTAKLPHETAMEELEAARAALLKDGDIKSYYIGISDTVRRYIERALNLRASEMTTPEFLESLKGSESLRMEQKDILKSFLNACDLVKFAKYEPKRNEIELVYLTARRFIEEARSYIEDIEGKND